MKYLKPVTLFILFLCLVPVALLAQTDCPTIAQQALVAADQYCQTTGRNQACYGNIQLSAEPQPNVVNFTFSKAGDLANVADIKSLKLNPMDTTAGTWGVALLRLQANLPDTVPGQNVTFLLFGDVQIDNAVQPGSSQYKPMQAFYFKSGVGDAPCAEAPESGLLVQTPKGAGQVAFTVNGVDIQMGSTVFFQGGVQKQSREMTVNTLEGAAFVKKFGKTKLALAGMRVRVDVPNLLDLPSGGGPAPAPPRPGDHQIAPDQSDLELGEAYDAQPFRALPINLLERQITIHPPLTKDELVALEQRKNAGKPLCGIDPLPSCDHLPPQFGGVLLPPDGRSAPDEQPPGAPPPGS